MVNVPTFWHEIDNKNIQIIKFIKSSWIRELLKTHYFFANLQVYFQLTVLLIHLVDFFEFKPLHFVIIFEISTSQLSGFIKFKG